MVPNRKAPAVTPLVLANDGPIAVFVNDGETSVFELVPKEKRCGAKGDGVPNDTPDRGDAEPKVIGLVVSTDLGVTGAAGSSRSIVSSGLPKSGFAGAVNVGGVCLFSGAASFVSFNSEPIGFPPNANPPLGIANVGPALSSPDGVALVDCADDEADALSSPSSSPVFVCVVLLSLIHI